MFRQVQQLAAELVINNFRKVDPISNVSEETRHYRDDRSILFDRRLYDLAENIAVEKEREGHCQRNFGRSLARSAWNSRQNSLSSSVVGRSISARIISASSSRRAISSADAGSRILSSISSILAVACLGIVYSPLPCRGVHREYHIRRPRRRGPSYRPINVAVTCTVLPEFARWIARMLQVPGAGLRIRQYCCPRISSALQSNALGEAGAPCRR